MMKIDLVEFLHPRIQFQQWFQILSRASATAESRECTRFKSNVQRRISKYTKQGDTNDFLCIYLIDSYTFIALYNNYHARFALDLKQILHPYNFRTWTNFSPIWWVLTFHSKVMPLTVQPLLPRQHTSELEGNHKRLHIPAHVGRRQIARRNTNRGMCPWFTNSPVDALSGFSSVSAIRVAL